MLWECKFFTTKIKFSEKLQRQLRLFLANSFEAIFSQRAVLKSAVAQRQTAPIVCSRPSYDRNGRQHPRIDTTLATPRPIDATAMDGGVLRTIRCLRVSQAVSHMFTDDSFGRSFVPFSPRRLFSLQVSVYVMSNWILCRARRGRQGRGEEGIP